MNRRLILAAAVAAAFATGLGGWFIAERTGPAPEPVADMGATEIGGPFRLIDQDGRAVTERDLLGRPTAMFFGFTYCPDVCPTTLGELTRSLAQLGPDADRLHIVFVSVDPERDTPEQLKSYLSSFDRRIRGLTGTPKAVAAMTEAYKVYATRTPLEGGGYTIDHSSMVYLFDAKGRFVEPIGYGEPPPRMTDALRRLARS